MRDRVRTTEHGRATSALRVPEGHNQRACGTKHAVLPRSHRDLATLAIASAQSPPTMVVHGPPKLRWTRAAPPGWTSTQRPAIASRGPGACGQRKGPSGVRRDLRSTAQRCGLRRVEPVHGSPDERQPSLPPLSLDPDPAAISPSLLLALSICTPVHRLSGPQFARQGNRRARA